MNQPCLVADIGGSNARFGLVEKSGGSVVHVRTLPVAAHAGLAEAVESYLAGLPGGADALPIKPVLGAVAVATAIAGDRVEFTNSPWSFSIEAVRTRLGLDKLLVLNDFEALALSLPRLRGDQLHAPDGLPTPKGTLAVIGPGTGLGVGGVIETAHGWVALPGEGGHATLAPADDYESELLALVRRDYAHVSAERLLSGIGLPVLHGAVARQAGHMVAPALTAEQIVEAGTTGSDALCVRTLEVFCALLGGFAGSVALTLGARGGVYIGGGIVPRLGELFFRSRFRERFEAKGRFRGYLEVVPTVLITDTLAALSGAALALEQIDL
ncbi:glucokinase [Pelomonas sp. SE-A7]|uniref:glucokinase n=1 Tax=Pelomonas sp. SE-A7 TaxID=3054953 RepID=UPI00259CB6BA|nr:glucokinase [Pelomonas sp. SE-A7]MDM4764645.1 glucokinase [Pelomonas sp. SE-A7]